MKEYAYLMFCFLFLALVLVIFQEVGAIRETKDLQLKCYQASTTDSDRALCEKVFGGGE